MQPVQREVVLEHARQRFQKAVAQREVPPAIGVVEAARLLDRREFIYRGRAYSVAPVPWDLALEIYDVREQLDRANKAGKVKVPEMSALFQRAAHLSKRACRPVGFFRRLLWRFLPNPFLSATPYLLGRNLGFFCTCLVLDSLDAAEAGTHARGGSSRTSQRSSGATRPGSALMASPSPGRIS